MAVSQYLIVSVKVSRFFSRFSRVHRVKFKVSVSVRVRF